MSDLTIGFLGVFVLLASILLGAPIMVALTGVGFAGLILRSNFTAAISILGTLYYSIGGPLAPLLYFIYRYIIRLGFLDGREGYLYHFLQGYWYRTLVAAKLLEFERLIRDCETNEQRLALLRRNTGLEL